MRWAGRRIGDVTAVEAVSICPTCAVPLMVGAPVAGSFTGVTLIVMKYSEALSAVPSFTLNLKLA